MYKRALVKPDGRALHLYSRRPIDEGLQATAPRSGAVAPNPHFRWHPLRGEWVAYASHRQNRTFQPPKEFNPLVPTRSAEFPTELPAGDYDAAVFDNLFPSMSLQAHSAPSLNVPTRPARGVCEVVVFTQDPDSSLGALPLDHLRLLVDVWAERSIEIGAREGIQYVMPFENRGAEMGVTLSHPHGQIYGYPFIPPVPARELAENRAHFSAHGRSLLEDLCRAEVECAQRLLFEDQRTLAFVPVCARYPYETWIVPRRRVGSLAQLEDAERDSFTRALKTVLLKFDGLWNRPFPYLMVFCQAPTDGVDRPEAHLHVEFYPALRSPDRLKYLAGTELGAGTFANDAFPEEKAAELRAVEVTLE